MARTKEDVAGNRITGIRYARDDHDVVLTAAAFLPREGVVKNVQFLPPFRAGTPAALIRADQATWDAARRTWVLVRGMRSMQVSSEIVQQAGARPREDPIDEFPFTLSPEQLILRRDAQWADLLSLRELNALINSRNLNNRSTVEMSRHLRVTQPLLHWILLALALPHFLARAPTNVLSAGGRALLLAGSFFLVSFVAASLVRDANNAALIAWVPILAFGPIAVFKLANVKT